jgi:hypothetical protein
MVVVDVRGMPRRRYYLHQAILLLAGSHDERRFNGVITS